MSHCPPTIKQLSENWDAIIDPNDYKGPVYRNCVERMGGLSFFLPCSLLPGLILLFTPVSAVHERGRKKECFLAQSLLLTWWWLLSHLEEKAQGPPVHHHRGLPRSSQRDSDVSLDIARDPLPPSQPTTAPICSWKSASWQSSNTDHRKHSCVAVIKGKT